MPKHLFTWDSFKEGGTLIIFENHNYASIRKFCENALEHDIKFVNKNTTIRTTQEAIENADWKIGLTCNKKGSLVRKYKDEYEGNIIYYNDLFYLPETAKKKPLTSKIFTLKDFEERKIAIRCHSLIEAKRLFEILNKQGWKWSSGERLLAEGTHWEGHREDTAYNAVQESMQKRIRYGRYQYSEDVLGYQIVNFMEVML